MFRTMGLKWLKVTPIARDNESMRKLLLVFNSFLHKRKFKVYVKLSQNSLIRELSTLENVDSILSMVLHYKKYLFKVGMDQYFY